MASLQCCESGVVGVSGTTLAVITLRNGTINRQNIDIEEKRLLLKKENQEEDNGKIPENLGAELTSKEGENRILACKFSPSWRYFAVCDDTKQLYLFHCGEQWEMVSNRVEQQTYSTSASIPPLNLRDCTEVNDVNNNANPAEETSGSRTV